MQKNEGYLIMLMKWTINQIAIHNINLITLENNYFCEYLIKHSQLYLNQKEDKFFLLNLSDVLIKFTEEAKQKIL